MMINSSTAYMEFRKMKSIFWKTTDGTSKKVATTITWICSIGLKKTRSLPKRITTTSKPKSILKVSRITSSPTSSFRTKTGQETTSFSGAEAFLHTTRMRLTDTTVVGDGLCTMLPQLSATQHRIHLP